MVGVLQYFPTQTDALNLTNTFGSSGYFTVGTYGGFTAWRIASNSTGSSSQVSVYMTGDTLNSDGNYKLYPSAPCFLEGSKILCQVDGEDKYLRIETIAPGTLVKTSLDGYKKVEIIGKGDFLNPNGEERTEERLYKCSPAAYPELTEDLIITGCHSVLVDELTDAQRAATMKIHGKIFVTDRKYRLMACVDERAVPWDSEGHHTIWHLALENADIKMNYGVFANGGLLVETCSINYLKTKTGMKFI